jgi:hypothetical protein
VNVVLRKTFEARFCPVALLSKRVILPQDFPAGYKMKVGMLMIKLALLSNE